MAKAAAKKTTTAKVAKQTKQPKSKGKKKTGSKKTVKTVKVIRGKVLGNSKAFFFMVSKNRFSDSKIPTEGSNSILPISVDDASLPLAIDSAVRVAYSKWGFPVADQIKDSTPVYLMLVERGEVTGEFSARRVRVPSLELTEQMVMNNQTEKTVYRVISSKRNYAAEKKAAQKKAVKAAKKPAAKVSLEKPETKKPKKPAAKKPATKKPAAKPKKVAAKKPVAKPKKVAAKKPKVIKAVKPKKA